MFNQLKRQIYGQFTGSIFHCLQIHLVIFLETIKYPLCLGTLESPKYMNTAQLYSHGCEHVI